MKTKKFLKVFLMLLLIFGLYCLYKINSSHSEYELWTKIHLNKLDSSVMAAHVLLPSSFRGKKLPFHRVYETRYVGFPEDLKKPRLFNQTKIILLWTPWNGIKKTINYYFLLAGNTSFVRYNCPNAKCVATYDRTKLNTADALLFHLLDTKSSDLPTQRIAHQFWILYNMEPPWQIRKHMYPELSHLKNTFNWTMTYRSDSDITARYGFIKPSSEILSLKAFKNKIKNVVWFVSDCKTDSKREEYVMELSKYIDVDIYGQCGTHKCYPSQSSICYEKIVERYKFYLSFENAICRDYVTEKFFNIFNYNIIPVVFGGAKYSLIGPEGTFVDATKYSQPQKLANALLEISNNEDLYTEMLSKKQSFIAYLDPWMCRLCDKLHTDNKTSILHDVEEWWLKEAECKTWDKTRHDFV